MIFYAKKCHHDTINKEFALARKEKKQSKLNTLPKPDTWNVTYTTYKNKQSLIDARKWSHQNVIYRSN